MAGTNCDAAKFGATATCYRGPDGEIVCRCLACARCGHHTGSTGQGHWWKACRVLGADRADWHFCCPDPAFGCELEHTARADGAT